MHRRFVHLLLSFSSATAIVSLPLSAQAQEPAPAPEPPPTPPPAPAAPDENAPLAGFHNGLFFLRDRRDVFRLYVQGRVHVDALTWLGPGVSSLGPDSALKSTLTLRRVRPEIGGEFFEEWQWQLSVDAAPTTNDNPAARVASRNCAPAASGALTCTDAENPVEAPLQRPLATDAFVNYAPSPWFNVQVGQYLIPFTMENRISDNTTPFLERSIVSRNLGTPFTRDIGAMIWGESPDHVIYYTVGAYNGDGPNRTNADDRFDFIGRAFARPLIATKGPLDHLQIGLSGRYGSRDPKLVGYDVNSLTTQGGYAFWRPTYKDSLGRTLHIIPSSEQGAFGADVFIPIDRFDLASEFVYAISNTREAVDGYQLSAYNERLTSLKGYAYYVMLGAWLVGSRDIIGYPSYGRPLHLDLSAPETRPERGLQALVKFEQLHLSYASRAGSIDPNTPIGDIDMRALSFGLNYWATRHLRVGLNYSFYTFPDSEPVAPTVKGGVQQSANQRALAPAQLVPIGADNDARDGGHTLHEIHARVGVQF